MQFRLPLFLAAVAAANTLYAADEPVVFRSEVALVRVDAQVVDGSNRAITGLDAKDFLLRDEGERQEIRNFSSEEMPVDVLLLLDVSRSMQPHVERLGSAAHTALAVLGSEDRVAIMVFDRATRLRMPFRANRSEIERGLEGVMRSEDFEGGTDITRALLDAAAYISREGRRDARRAVVILTDDQTERDRDEERVNRALVRADTVLSALLAPDAMRSGRGWPQRGGRTGGGWPGGGWPNDPLGGVIWGRRGPWGTTIPGGGMGGGTQPAGTGEIAEHSGGDVMRVDEAGSFESTLRRIRQRYALHYYMPSGAQGGQDRRIEVALNDEARRRYPGAEVRFRRIYQTPNEVASSSPGGERSGATGDSSASRQRPARVDETPDTEPRPATGGWRRAEGHPEQQEAAPAPPPAAEQPQEQPRQGGWRRVKPGEQP